MPTISFDITRSEFLAIQEFAKICNENISELVRKIIIQEITYMKYSRDFGAYNYEIVIPHDLSGDKREQFLAKQYNKIRTILGIAAIDLD